ncbi:hypothetical protein LS684_23500 (plasmid) [Cytobacillus spongiae]|uniref:hypothetical protein n=1 Tax=Cytobacillus spongiae TaxID=2901381 RepID=UPI001F25B6F4|nr:hypothetical protein [Cytobacillus spongiae]UII58556.1 hypothetical protein LS684_23500 [Cytobacillus spongiae]
MVNVRVKVMILGILLVLLMGLFVLKIVVISQKEWVLIEEKYFPVNGNKGSTGIKTGEVIDEKNRYPSCSMRFDNGRTYKVDCDQYLDFNVGEKVRIITVDNEYAKLRRK